jgi:hypothetical protein
MSPLLALLGLGVLGAVVVAESSSSSSSSSTGGGGGGFPPAEQTGGTSNLPSSGAGGGMTVGGYFPGTSPDTIEMSCDDAFKLLPKEIQLPVATAMLHGINVPALNALADQMDSIAETIAEPNAYAAYKVVAHCLRARAMTVSVSPTAVATQIPVAA